MKICRIAIDVANNNSAIATALYEEFEDGTRERILETARLWNDIGANSQNSCLIPSVIIYKEKNPKSFHIKKDCYGHDAISVLNRTDVKLNICLNMKKKFFVDRETWGDNRSAFKDFVKYLLDCVDFNSFEKVDSYELWYSYPVICNEGDHFDFDEVFWDVLKDRNLPNYSVHSIDEAECSFNFAIANENVKNVILNELEKKEEVFCLLCDIGGSTMELSLYRFSRVGNMVNQTRIDILCADSHAGRGMGGYRMDKSLCNTLNNLGVLNQTKIKEIPEELLLMKWFAPLKEDLNNHLRENNVGLLDRLHSIAVLDKLNENRKVKKDLFEKWCNGYTSSVCNKIKSLLEKSNMIPEQIDIAILTGGGCELYPIEIAIKKLIDPDGNMNSHVVRPNSPLDILDFKIADIDNPDYIDGLCPTEEISSLACVLGNLAGKNSLTLSEDDEYDGDEEEDDEEDDEYDGDEEEDDEEDDEYDGDEEEDDDDVGVRTQDNTGNYSSKGNGVNPLPIVSGTSLVLGSAAAVAAGVGLVAAAPFALLGAVGIAMGLNGEP